MYPVKKIVIIQKYEKVCLYEQLPILNILNKLISFFFQIWNYCYSVNFKCKTKINELEWYKKIEQFESSVENKSYHFKNKCKFDCTYKHVTNV